MSYEKHPVEHGLNAKGVKRKQRPSFHLYSSFTNPHDIINRPGMLKKMTMRDLRIMKNRLEKSLNSPYYRVGNDAISMGFSSTNSDYEKALRIIKNEMKRREK